MSKLIQIQSELKAPKNQFNGFGKYKYRSCEDILEALKPLLKKHACQLTLTDEIKEIGGVIFCEATARLITEEGATEVKAQAGIDVDKKGMDISQTFGSSSSYARKYALNGLFLIDDAKDADTNEQRNHIQNAPKPNTSKNTEPAMWLNEDSEQWQQLEYSLFQGKTFTLEQIKKKYKVSKQTAEKLKELGIS